MRLRPLGARNACSLEAHASLLSTSVLVVAAAGTAGAGAAVVAASDVGSTGNAVAVGGGDVVGIVFTEARTGAGVIGCHVHRSA